MVAVAVTVAVVGVLVVHPDRATESTAMRLKVEAAALGIIISSSN